MKNRPGRFPVSIQGRPNERLLNQIDSALVNKDESIDIMALSYAAGSADFATELAELMKKRGYSKVSVSVGTRSPIPKKGVTLNTIGGKKQLLINVD